MFHPNSLPLGRGHNKFTVFGREFKYKQGDRIDERRAEHDAQIYAAAQKQRRQDLCGRPLSEREILYNSVYHEDGRTLRDKINQQSTTCVTNEKIEFNPHAARLEQLRAMTCYTPKQEAQRQRRIDQCQREADAWDAGRLPKVETNNPNAVTSAVNHAKLIERAVLDSTETTQEDVERAAERLRIAGSEPERYQVEYAIWKSAFDARVEAKAVAALAPMKNLVAEADKIRAVTNLPDAPAVNQTKEVQQ